MNRKKLGLVLHCQTAALATSKIDNSLLRIMFAPAGDHEIHCGLGDNAKAVVTIRVDKSTVAVLNASLAKNNADEAPQRALFDFEHQAKEAMAWPIAFHWEDMPAPGVYAMAEYSKLGKEYVEGKMVRAFSGSFFTDANLPKKKKDVKAGATYVVQAGQRGSAENPARIIGLDFPYAGTLTNNPAFRANEPLFAMRRMNADPARLAANRAYIRESRKYAALLLERNNQLLAQLIRRPDESEQRTAAVDAVIRSRRAERAL
jgi:hypothetical protein